MTDDTGKVQSEFTWPLPNFFIKVNIGDEQLRFQEVSGLDSVVEPSEYRAGNSKVLSVVKMPGLPNYSNILLRRGLVLANSGAFQWFRGTALNALEPKTVTISLLDESDTPKAVWRIDKAIPIKMSFNAMQDNVDEIAVDELVLGHEGYIRSK